MSGQFQILTKENAPSNPHLFSPFGRLYSDSFPNTPIDFKRVSLIIPSKNEAENLAEILDMSQGLFGELIVVDGHSTDQTAVLARSRGAKVVLDNAKGKGDALRVGAQAATRDFLVFMDADGSHDPMDIPRMVAPLFDEKADMVIGSRSTGGSDELSGNWGQFLRLMGSHIILLGINWRFKVNLTDSQNGFRAIRRDVFLKLDLKEEIHTIEQEMTIKCLKEGYTIDEVPSHEYARKNGSSHIRLSKVWFRYVSSWIRGLLW